MRKILFTIIFLVAAVLVAWAIAVAILRRETPESSVPSPAPIPEAVAPTVTAPPPDESDALLQDALDEAMADIEALE